MIRAIYKDGVLRPLDPIPQEWSDGRELNIEPAEPPWAPDAAELERIDEWYRELEALSADVDPEDMKILRAALDEADEQAKSWVRREMGLDP